MRAQIREMEDLLNHEYGEVALRSPFIAEIVYDAIHEFRESGRRAVTAIATMKEAAERGLDEALSAFIARAEKHGVDVADERDALMFLRMNPESLSEVKRQVRKRYELWTKGGRDPAEFRGVKIRFEGGSVTLAGRYIRV